MPKLNVSKSIFIDKSPEEVFKLLNDFSKWDAWSPWNILEKNVQLKVSENNKFHEWVGDITGSGNMRVISEKQNENVYIDLTFLKPFKSKAKVDFQLKAEGSGTQVTWNMQSSMPFFLFFMVKPMTIYLGMDFDRGLLLLKDVAQDGVAHCQLEMNPSGNYAGGKYIGIRSIISTSKGSEAMETSFTTLLNYATSKEDLIAGNPFTIYNDWNLVKGKADFITAVPVNEIPSDLPTGFITGQVHSTPTYVVKSTGPYHHIGNAWTSIEMLARAKKFKKNKAIKPMEVYLNSPKNTPVNELMTEIHMPKG